jgi:hypothetical protein
MGGPRHATRASVRFEPFQTVPSRSAHAVELLPTSGYELKRMSWQELRAVGLKSRWPWRLRDTRRSVVSPSRRLIGGEGMKLEVGDRVKIESQSTERSPGAAATFSQT